MNRFEFRQLKSGDAICRLDTTWIVVIDTYTMPAHDAFYVVGTILYHIDEDRHFTSGYNCYEPGTRIEVVDGFSHLYTKV